LQVNCALSVVEDELVWDSGNERTVHDDRYERGIEDRHAHGRHFVNDSEGR
jgi:hypothetical protein